MFCHSRRSRHCRFTVFISPRHCHFTVFVTCHAGSVICRCLHRSSLSYVICNLSLRHCCWYGALSPSLNCHLWLWLSLLLSFVIVICNCHVACHLHLYRYHHHCHLLLTVALWNQYDIPPICLRLRYIFCTLYSFHFITRISWCASTWS